jgi:hypothetical protein
MKYNRTSINIQSEIHIKYDKRSAYHLAGYAVAIIVGNFQKCLPPVYFQINTSIQEGKTTHKASLRQSQQAKFEGGRLIPSLPFSYAVTIKSLSWPQQQEYQSAFEADVMNLLAGAMAESQVMSDIDSQAFTADQVYRLAQRGNFGLETVGDYLACLQLDPPGRKQKLAELFLAAYRFIIDPYHWHAITALAEYIWQQPAGIISCEDVSAVLTSAEKELTIPLTTEFPGFFAKR